MRLVPKSALSRAVGTLTRLPAPAGVHRAAMRAFARAYRVDMAEAETDFGGYGRFSDFFSRGLRPGARPVDSDPRVVVSPVDGAVSQAGILERGSCLQAKGIEFPVDRLLDDADLAARFALGGAYATLYLSPRDYHRVHSPLEGVVVASRYLPGEFWPVNPATVRNRDALFCSTSGWSRWLDTPAFGRVAVVKVGATCVARIRATYDDRLTHAGQSRGASDLRPAASGGEGRRAGPLRDGLHRHPPLRAGPGGLGRPAGGRTRSVRMGAAHRRRAVSQQISGVKGMNDLLPPDIEVWHASRPPRASPSGGSATRSCARRWWRTPRSSCAAWARPPTSSARRCTPSPTRRAQPLAAAGGHRAARPGLHRARGRQPRAGDALVLPRARCSGTSG